MHRQFDSPAKFLEYVQTAYSKPVHFDRSDKTFDGMTKEALEQLGIKHSDEDLHTFKPLTDRLTSIVESAVSSSELSTIRRSLAIGTLAREDFNAMCIKSSDGWYAIVINYALFMYLNIYFKLQAAINDPSVVVYCNPGNPEDLKTTDYEKYFDHLNEQYQLHGAPYGPKIKLNKEATITNSMNLLVAELFVLGHEVGHFLNGDLEDDTSLVPHPRLPEVRMLAQDRDRDKEIQADITGYRLLNNGLKAQLPHFAQDDFVFGVVMNLMDALYFVTLDKGSSHPTSIERTISIARNFYGERIADLARWAMEADAGDHFRLAFDQPDTWSQKYNLVWDRVLGLNLFPAAVAQKEMAFYRRMQGRYGLALDNRRLYTKLDWITWTATLTRSPADFEALVAPVFDFLNATPHRVPMSDWYWTHDATKTGFQARSVVGGVFLRLLYDEGVWKKWEFHADRP